MEIKRTANAGVLLKMDGKRILMDGLSQEVKPYLATPRHIREALLKELPDALLFTHCHEDHYDATFVSEYLQMAAGPILGPADIPFCSQMKQKIGEICVTPIPSRHVGKYDQIGHVSFILEGSQCVWFMGDASPLQWGKQTELPKPDVLVAPYAYGVGNGWNVVKGLGAKKLVLLHLPARNADPFGLWGAVESSLDQKGGVELYIPDMNETVNI